MSRDPDPVPALTLGEVDADGALTDALCSLHGFDRATLLRSALIGSGVLLAAAAEPARAAPSRRDTAILNYALTLEYVQDSFYSEALRLDALRDAKLREQARVVAAHERAHVEALRGVLGSLAVQRPHFDFRGATEDDDSFRKTAVAFEDLAVAAYKGQAPRIQQRSYLVPALAIHTVEARHAAWIRRLANVAPVASAFDEPRSRASTLAIVARTHFVMATGSTQRPRFTG